MTAPPKTNAPALLVAAAAAFSPSPALADTVRGHVLSGATPLAAHTVTLYATDPRHPLRCAAALGSATTSAAGFFEIGFTAPAASDAVLYLIADQTRSDARARGCRSFTGPVVLGSVLGHEAPAEVVVNERTTVAFAYGLAQFIRGPRIGGKAPGLQNAAAMSRNLVDPRTGEVGEVLASAPNGGETETLPTFNSLANLVAACVASESVCASLFALATPWRGPPPADTLQALVDIARAPAQAVQAIFDLSQMPPEPYHPSRPPGAPPSAWTLALRFVGNGVSMDGPGNIAIDAAGSLWVSNNYTYSPDGDAAVCGGKGPSRTSTATSGSPTAATASSRSTPAETTRDRES